MPDTQTLFPFIDVAMQLAALTTLTSIVLLYGLPRLGALGRRLRMRPAPR